MINENSSRDEVLAAVRQNGRALEFASEDFRADSEVVLSAVKQKGGALRCASEDLRKDKEVVLEAIKQNGNALWFASYRLRKDKEVVLAAVQQNGWALYRALGNLERHPLLQSIAEETKRGNKQNISYKLFCFVEKNPELYKLGFLTSNEMRSFCNSQSAVSSVSNYELVFNFAKYQLDNQRCKPEPTDVCRCVIS